MTDVLLVIVGIITAANLLLLVLLLVRRVESPLPPLEAKLSGIEKLQERGERGIREEIARNREEGAATARQGREELAAAMKQFGESLLARMAESVQFQKAQLDIFSSQLTALTRSNEQKLEQMRLSVEGRLQRIQEDNAQKLEQMRATVDEKLHATLEQRLAESFKLVSERLEQVHAGLGEMKSLAAGVGDLKKVLTNIKTRGCWGEVQLGNLLEQMLTPDQYAANVAPNPLSGERVEYAVKLPGREGPGTNIWLPIDAKFPQEDYQRLVEAQEQIDAAAVEAAALALEGRVWGEARKIKEKYICPPHTTDFAIMFLPTEGLFAEALRRPGLCDGILREHRVVITGPTTLAAVLSSLQMGFRTLAIEKRSSEVWVVLGAVKTEFSKFGDVLEKVQKKLQEASNSIDQAAVRSRAVQRKLRDVQEAPAEDAQRLLGDGDALEAEGTPAGQ